MNTYLGYALKGVLVAAGGWMFHTCLNEVRVIKEKVAPGEKTEIVRMLEEQGLKVDFKGVASPKEWEDIKFPCLEPGANEQEIQEYIKTVLTLVEKAKKQTDECRVAHKKSVDNSVKIIHKTRELILGILNAKVQMSNKVINANRMV